MGARVVSNKVSIFAILLFVIIFILACMPEALANSVTLSVNPQFQIADGYSTSIVTATADSAGPGQMMNFTITDSSGTKVVVKTTDNSGIASINVGPYPYGVPDSVSIKAECIGISSGTETIKFLAKNDLKIFISPGTTEDVSTPITVTALWSGSNGMPLTFTTYDPNLNLMNTQTIPTDGSGIAIYNFTLSDTAGYNWIIISLNGVTLKSKYVMGRGGQIDVIQLKSTPQSPIFADGMTSYTISVKALDLKGNTVPGKNISIYVDGEKSFTYPTNSNGALSIVIGSSTYVKDINITATAEDTLASKSINLSYIKGIASNVSVLANPPVVANANISTVPGQAEVHTTDITTMLTDVWGHPIQGETVYAATLNTSLGSMYQNDVPVAVASGVTDESGQFTAQFKLGDDVDTTDIDIGVPILAWYNNSTTGVDTSALCYVLYTDKPFVVATTSYVPSNNLTVNDTINVTVKLRACGWINRTNYNNSAILLFDTSGSMDWLANTIYPADGLPEQGYVSKATNSIKLPTGQYFINPSDWHPITSYSYTGDGIQDLQFMLSSDYRRYNGGAGSFYFLKVIDPSGYAYTTDNGGYTGGNVVALSSSNENSIKFTSAVSGTYQIYGAYIKNAADTPYNLMVLTNPKRLGQNTGSDMGSAAKVAGTKFVSLMNKNQVGVVWFNDSYPIPPVAKFTASPVVGNAPLLVQFTDLSDYSPATWSWNFGDGGTSNIQNPPHTYATAGVYNVKLTVTNTGGSDSVTYNNYITVHHAAPSPAFTGTPVNGFVPLTVQFTDGTGDSSVTGWLWSFGDGQTSTLQNPSHQYTSTGTYTVTLTETNDGGSGTLTKMNYISVNPHNVPPVASFTENPMSGNVPLTVQFTDTSAGNNILTRSWTFGDGQSTMGLNPSHKYTTTGTFTVTLTVTNDGGSSSTSQTVTVTHNTLPVADFTGTPTSGNAPLTVYFTDTSAGNNIGTWQWDYGDHTANGTTKNPGHQYTVPGTYTVTLTVINDAGSSTIQKVDYITVNVAPTPTPTATPSATPTATATATPTATPTPTPVPPVAAFTGSPVSGYAPLSVQFTDQSTNTPTSWYWDFGDGGTDTAQSPIHIYNTPGKYSVSLTATNSAGSGTLTKTDYITVNAHNAMPVADFIGTPTSGNQPLTVKFTNMSTGNNIYGWYWIFGDGGTSTAQNPIHTYANAGTYTVTFTATNDAGGNTATKTDYITVSHNAPPVADFTENPMSGNVPLTVYFTDTSTGSNILSRSWTFGDGQSGTGQTPSHIYTTTGTFLVTLTVTNDGGSSTTSQTVVVTHNSPPVVSFFGTPTSGNIPLTVQFTDTSTGSNILSRSWNFGDGGTSTVQNPSHQYTSMGFYTVTLTETNDAGSDIMTRDSYIVAYNALPTVPPMLAGVLANMLNMFSIDVNADAPMTAPAGTAIGLTTINNITALDANGSIYGLRAYGGTNIAAGITKAISEFNGPDYTPGNRKYIVLLTDGYSQYPDDDITAAQAAAAQNITIYTVGIGMPDEATLKNIAQITGGTYTKVTSLPDLVNTFSAIANNMTDVAGYNISLCTFTNYTNGISPDTLYVPNSSIITQPNGVKVQKDPIIIRDDSDDMYNLIWDGLGNLSYNQNMTIFYQLKVKTAGNITPITDDSYVEFWMGNESMRSSVEAPTLNVKPLPDNITGLAPPDLAVSIVTPLENSTTTSQRMLISWNTIYTGSDTYDQIVECNGINLLPLAPSGYTSGTTEPWQYTWDISTMPSGYYSIKVFAYDSYCNSTAWVNVTIDHSTGKIRLE